MRKQKTTVFLVLMCLLVGLVVVVVARNIRNSETNLSPQSVIADSTRNKRGYVRRSILHPRVGWALSQLGDRLERPGKERSIALGAIRYASNETTQPVILLNEFPDRSRLTVMNGESERTIIFDGDRSRATSRLSEIEEALLETLIYDSSEHFFWSQTQQLPARFIASRLRTDDGSNPDYRGPYYDVYQLTDSVRIGPTECVRTKLYYFNSDTLLLERVVYEKDKGGAKKVEVLLSDWRSLDGQRIPHRIERIENGSSNFVVSISSLNIAPRVDDDIFSSLPAN